jgi:hypothetical protein
MVISGIHFVSGCSELSYRSYRMSQYSRVGELRSFWLLVAIVARTDRLRGVVSILLVFNSMPCISIHATFYASW